MTEVTNDIPQGVMGKAGIPADGLRRGVVAPETVSAGFHMPDYSEFQTNVNWPALVAENGGVAVIRAMYGSGHIDGMWPGRRTAAHGAGIQNLGIYQYLRADQDAISQARAFAGLVGKLQPGEFAVLDLEEGSGNQLGRANAWLATIKNILPAYEGYQGAWLYSGLDFAITSGLSSLFNGSQVHTWVAAYGGPEPTLGHSLWQHSNGQIGNCTYEPWPGGFVDCSSRAGGIADLQALIGGGSDNSVSHLLEAGMEIKPGYGVQTIIKFVGGSANGITFGCNAGEVGLNAPYLKLAIQLPDGTWSRSRIRVPTDTSQQDGKISVDFPGGGDGIGMVSVIRDSNGGADAAAVGYNLY